MELPERLLPEPLDELGIDEVLEAAKATARLVDRSHHDLGRALNRIYEEGCRKLGYGSIADFAGIELGLGTRHTYQLMQVDKRTKELPKVREAYARGEVHDSNVRTIVEIATPEDEEEWLELAKTRSNRQLYRQVKAVAHARAEREEAAWPETGIYGKYGRPDPARRLPRPYTRALLEIESRVMEQHNRFAGCDTSWGEFFEAALISYEHELRLAAEHFSTGARETLDRDGWRCRVPHCSRRSALETHHVVRRSQGGSDDPDSCICLCFVHHGALHDGLLLIEGTAARGFRFAHRARPGDEWVYWPEGSDTPLDEDPHDSAWDLEACRDQVYPDTGDGAGRVRSMPPRYGGPLEALVSRRVHTRSQDVDYTWTARIASKGPRPEILAFGSALGPTPPP